MHHKSGQRSHTHSAVQLNSPSPNLPFTSERNPERNVKSRVVPQTQGVVRIRRRMREKFKGVSKLIGKITRRDQSMVRNPFLFFSPRRSASPQWGGSPPKEKVKRSEGKKNRETAAAEEGGRSAEKSMHLQERAPPLIF